MRPNEYTGVIDPKTWKNPELRRDRFLEDRLGHAKVQRNRVRAAGDKKKIKATPEATRDEGLDVKRRRSMRIRVQRQRGTHQRAHQDEPGIKKRMLNTSRDEGEGPADTTLRDVAWMVEELRNVWRE